MCSWRVMRSCDAHTVNGKEEQNTRTRTESSLLHESDLSKQEHRNAFDAHPCAQMDVVCCSEPFAGKSKRKTRCRDANALNSNYGNCFLPEYALELFTTPILCQVKPKMIVSYQPPLTNDDAKRWIDKNNLMRIIIGYIYNWKRNFIALFWSMNVCVIRSRSRILVQCMAAS